MKSKPQCRIVITGTHQSPAIELIRQMAADNTINWNLYYLGRKNRSHNLNILSTEYQLLQNHPQVKYFSLNSGKLDRNNLFNTISGIPHTLASIIKSYNYLKDIKPRIIVSFGGYISIPVLIAGKILGIKSIIHEQTLTNSLTTKLSIPFVNKIALTFDDENQKKQLPLKKIVITGNLLRHELFINSNSEKIKKLFQRKKPVLYITGGNQGSQAINKIVLKSLPKIIPEFNVIHQVGSIDLINTKEATLGIKNYYCQDYFLPDEVSTIYKYAEIVISRSGANITQELVALNKKAILIPLPNSQQNEQLKNAQWAIKQHPQMFSIIEQKNLDSNLLTQEISKLKSIKIKVNHQPDSTNYRLLNLIKNVIFASSI